MDTNTIEYTEKPFSEMIAEYADLFLRWLWLLIICVVLASVTTYFISAQSTPIYQASTIVLVSGASSTQFDSYNALVTGERLAETYAQVMTTRPVLDGVAQRLGLEYFPASITVRPIANTQLLRVIVQDTDPVRAAQIANALVVEFAERNQADQAARYASSKANLENQLAILDTQIVQTTNEIESLGQSTEDLEKKSRLQTTLSQYRQSYASLTQSYEQIRLAEAQSTSSVIQKEPAIPNMAPIQPQPLRNALLAGVVGLFVAIGIVVLIDMFDDSLRDPTDITRKWGVPILGVIATFPSRGGEDETELITAIQPRSPVSESFRSLRTNLQYASVDTPVRNILVTSPSPQDGKSTIAANLGIVLAQSGRKAVIIDADLRRPRLHKIFNIQKSLGLSELFIQTASYLNGAVQSTFVQNLFAVTSGNKPPNPSELLSSNRMIELIHQLNEHFDYVILDTPPTLAVTDAAVLGPRVDGVIVVVKPSETKRRAINQVIEQFQHVGANILGVVLNDVELNRSRYHYRNYYYYGGHYSAYQYYGEDDKEKKNAKTDTPIQKPGTAEKKPKSYIRSSGGWLSIKIGSWEAHFRNRKLPKR